MSKQNDWQCASCTFINKCVNPATSKRCGMCQTPRIIISMQDRKRRKDIKKFLKSIDDTCYQLYFDIFISEGFDRLDNIREIGTEDLGAMNVSRAW